MLTKQCSSLLSGNSKNSKLGYFQNIHDMLFSICFCITCFKTSWATQFLALLYIKKRAEPGMTPISLRCTFYRSLLSCIQHDVPFQSAWNLLTPAFAHIFFPQTISDWNFLPYECTSFWWFFCFFSLLTCRGLPCVSIPRFCFLFTIVHLQLLLLLCNNASTSFRCFRDMALCIHFISNKHATPAGT